MASQLIWDGWQFKCLGAVDCEIKPSPKDFFLWKFGRRLKKPAEKNLLSDGKNIRVLAYGESNVNINENFFPTYFWCPRSQTYHLLEGLIMGLHGYVFPSWDSNLGSWVLIRKLIKIKIASPRWVSSTVVSSLITSSCGNSSFHLQN